MTKSVEIKTAHLGSNKKTNYWKNAFSKILCMYWQNKHNPAYIFFSWVFRQFLSQFSLFLKTDFSAEILLIATEYHAYESVTQC